MISWILIINKQGKVRMAKYYCHIEAKEKHELHQRIHRVITSRSSKFTNFVDDANHKIVYRRYAGLYFCFAVDLDASVLSTLEIIHLFVEVLDQYFGNATEGDLIFKFYQVYNLLDEMLIGGEVMETSKEKILKRLHALDRLH